MTGRPLAEVARIVRSKNAGPTLLTIDVIFSDDAGFRRGCAALTSAEVARLYRRAEGDVRVIPFAPAFAIKIVLPRAVPAGGPGDRDIYGAQQHGPLLSVPV